MSEHQKRRNYGNVTIRDVDSLDMFQEKEDLTFRYAVINLNMLLTVCPNTTILEDLNPYLISSKQEKTFFKKRTAKCKEQPN